jgi:hypothetical protein
MERNLLSGGLLAKNFEDMSRRKINSEVKASSNQRNFLNLEEFNEEDEKMVAELDSNRTIENSLHNSLNTRNFQPSNPSNPSSEFQNSSKKSKNSSLLKRSPLKVHPPPVRKMDVPRSKFPLPHAPETQIFSHNSNSNQAIFSTKQRSSSHI